MLRYASAEEQEAARMQSTECDLRRHSMHSVTHRSTDHCVANTTYGCDPLAVGRFWVRGKCAGDFSCGSAATRFCGHPGKTSGIVYCDCPAAPEEPHPVRVCWRDSQAGQPPHFASQQRPDAGCSKEELSLLWPTALESKQRAGPTERVAVCVAGNVRTFTLCNVHESIRRRLIDVLSAGAAVDVFAVLALQDAGTKLQQGFVRNPAATVTMQDLMAALAHLEPRALELFDRGPAIALNSHCPLHGRLRGDLGDRALGQLLKFSRCMNLIEAAEAKDGRPYDRIIRTRPDLLWSRDHWTIQKMKPTAGIFSKYPDQHFVLPRVAATNVMRIYDRYHQCNASTYDDPLFNGTSMELLVTDAALEEFRNGTVNVTQPYTFTGWPGLRFSCCPQFRQGTMMNFFSLARPPSDQGDALHRRFHSYYTNETVLSGIACRTHRS